jgi:transcriptional regulator with XRE-family HTH domain
MHFGKWAKSVRESRDMGSTECANRAGMTVQGWSNMERLTESPKGGTISKVGRAFDMTPEAVMTATGLSSTPVNQDDELALFLSRQSLKIPAARRTEFRCVMMKTAEAWSSVLSSAS